MLDPSVNQDYPEPGSHRNPEPLAMASIDRITCDPRVMGGKACVRGMRITVSLVINLVASGMTEGEILAAYPILELEDIRQALRYAAWLAEEAVLPSEVASA
jgi:uncharacterized protein (DUF433 family)